MPNGADLIQAIANNNDLTSLSDCGAVPAYVSEAIYGQMQDETDGGQTITVKGRSELEKELRTLIKVPKGFNRTHTFPWHFLTSPGIHHFLVIPWFDEGPRSKWVYTVLMAYVDAYTLGSYMTGEGKAPKRPPVAGGYQLRRTEDELVLMLSEVLRCGGNAWVKYFGNVVKRNAKQITCWRYPPILIETAIHNVQGYVRNNA